MFDKPVIPVWAVKTHPSRMPLSLIHRGNLLFHFCTGSRAIMEANEGPLDLRARMQTMQDEMLKLQRHVVRTNNEILVLFTRMETLKEDIEVLQTQIIEEELRKENLERILQHIFSRIPQLEHDYTEILNHPFQRLDPNDVFQWTSRSQDDTTNESNEVEM